VGCVKGRRYGDLSCIYHSASPPFFCDAIRVSRCSLGCPPYSLIPAHPVLPLSIALEFTVYMYFFCTCISSCPYTHFLPRSVGRASIFFAPLLLFLSLALARCSPQPRSLRFFFSQLTFSLSFFTIFASILPNLFVFSAHNAL